MTDGAPAPGRLAGKSVLVTGGGTGIGRACAARLAAEGAAVTICGRTEPTLAEAEAAIECGAGGSVSYVVADVTSEDDMARAAQAAADDDGHLHGVVANAGGGGHSLRRGPDFGSFLPYGDDVKSARARP